VNYASHIACIETILLLNVWHDASQRVSVSVTTVTDCPLNNRLRTDWCPTGQNPSLQWDRSMDQRETVISRNGHGPSIFKPQDVRYIGRVSGGDRGKMGGGRWGKRLPSLITVMIVGDLQLFSGARAARLA